MVEWSKKLESNYGRSVPPSRRGPSDPFTDEIKNGRPREPKLPSVGAVGRFGLLCVGRGYFGQDAAAAATADNVEEGPSIKLSSDHRRVVLVSLLTIQHVVQRNPIWPQTGQDNTAHGMAFIFCGCSSAAAAVYKD